MIVIVIINAKIERSILASRTLSRGRHDNKYDTDFMINLVKEYGRRYLVSKNLISYEINDKSSYFKMLENINETILAVSGTIRVAAKDFKKDIVDKVFYIIDEFIEVDRHKPKDNKFFYKFEVLEAEKQSSWDSDSSSREEFIKKNNNMLQMMIIITDNLFFFCKTI